jgi:hypothetical protein
MKLRANVSRIAGVSHHADHVDGRHVQDVQALTMQVEITEGPPGFSLLHMDAEGDCVADTWHPTLAEAVRQAKTQFGIEEADWTSTSD